MENIRCRRKTERRGGERKTKRCGGERRTERCGAGCDGERDSPLMETRGRQGTERGGEVGRKTEAWHGTENAEAWGGAWNNDASM